MKQRIVPKMRKRTYKLDGNVITFLSVLSIVDIPEGSTFAVVDQFVLPLYHVLFVFSKLSYLGLLLIK